jgi:xanthine dehydrogenase accessory factor
MVSPLQAVQDLLEREVYGSVVTITDGPEVGGKAVVDSSGVVVAGSIPDQIAEDVIADALTLIEHEQHRTMQYGDHEVFIETLAPPPEMVIFGAVHVAQSLAAFASQMGYRATVADSRAMFATEERFPGSRVLVGNPDEILDQITLDRRTWVIILSHEKRLEDPVIEAALKSPVRYIGAMGSRRTHGLRVERLKEKGFSNDDIARIHGPVGLDIGAESPQEVAVSILAEMTQVRYGHGTGMPLRGVEGRVHKQRPEKTGEVLTE